MINRKSYQSGFTLVEMAVVVFLIGILATMGIAAANAVIAASAISDTKKKQETIKEALIIYLSRNKRLPCPAINADGRENRPATTCVGFNPGILPYADLGLPKSAALDGWENLFSYAVSPEWTLTYSTLLPLPTGPFSNVMANAFNAGDAGGLTVKTRLANGSEGANSTSVAIVISHGKDGQGAITSKGTPNDPPPADALDQIAQLPNITAWGTTTFFWQREFSDVAGPNKSFDDVLATISANDLVAPLIKDGSIKSAEAQMAEQLITIRNAVVDFVITNCTLPTSAQLGTLLVDPYGNIITYSSSLPVPATIRYSYTSNVPPATPAASTPIYQLTDALAMPAAPDVFGPSLGTIFGLYSILPTRCP